MSMPWIKLYTEILDDPKLGQLSDSAKWRFMQLCLMAGECDAEGYLVNGITPLTRDEIAWRLRVERGTLASNLIHLIDIGLICEDEDGALFVTNFSKRQGRSQSEKREMWRERKRRQRDKESQQAGNPDDSAESVTRDSSVNHAGVTALEGEENRGEGDQKEDPAPDGAPPSEPEAKPRTPHQAMFGALLTVYKWDSQLITEKQRGRLNSEAKRLLNADKNPRDVWAAGEWWWENDWRGKKGSTPTYGQLVETLGKVEEIAVTGPAELERYQ